MKPHLIQAHHYWKQHISKGDVIIDATLGNGHDTIYLANLLQGSGQLIGYDIQEKALEQTKKQLDPLPDDYRQNITLKLQSHVNFDERQVKLIVYNLGYLPGGNKLFTTLSDTTLQSLQQALQILSPEGAVSITCYPGHQEGAKEEKDLIAYLSKLPASKWQVCRHCWINRPLSASLVWIKSLPGA